MLALLNQSQDTCYRVPYSILSSNDPYAVGAYLMALRYSTRFHEAAGSIHSYLKFFGVTPDAHSGNTIDKMREGLMQLTREGVFESKRPIDVKNLAPTETFCWKFAPKYGWDYKDYSLGILYRIKEIENGAFIAKSQRWNGLDNFIEVVYLMGYLRSYMEVPPHTLNPKRRWEQACGYVDFETVRNTFGISDNKLKKRLQRINSSRLGVVRLVKLKNKAKPKDPMKMLILAYNTSKNEDNTLYDAKKALKEGFAGFEIRISKDPRTTGDGE